MTDHPQLITITEASKLTGMPRRTIQRRVSTDASIRVYRDGRDRRKHMLDARDLPRLTELQVVTRTEPKAA